MFFKINASNGVPVYEQVARQIMFAVASGGLESGEMVPSVRQMAKDLAINPNTVARAYRQLQDQGIVATVRGSGLEVTKGASGKCKSARLRLIRDRIKQVVIEARRSQMSDEEIRKIVSEQLQNKNNK